MLKRYYTHFHIYNLKRKVYYTVSKQFRQIDRYIHIHIMSNKNSKNNNDTQQSPLELNKRVEMVNTQIQQYIDDFKKKEQWNDNKNIALISCFGNLVKDLQQYETVKGTLGQQKKAIDKKSQLYNIQKQDINLVNVEIQNILGKQKGNNNKMEVVDENNNDVKQEKNISTTTSSENKGKVGDVVDDNNIDPVAEILQDLDRFRNAFVQVLRWDDLDKQDDSSNIRQISGKLNEKIKNNIEKITNSINRLKHTNVSRDDQFQQLASLQAKDSRLTNELDQKIKEAERLSEQLNIAKKNIYKVV